MIKQINKKTLISLPILILILISSYLFVSFNFDSIFSKEIERKEQDSVIVIKFASVGDLMCHSVQFDYAHVDGDSFDFLPVYGEVKSFFQSKDIVFGNLESVFAGKDEKYSGFPFFNSPDDYIVALKQVGFNFLNTANNHSLDRKEKGLLRTIAKLKELGINYFGTYESYEDRDSIRMFEKENFKIALLGYSYGTNGLPIPKGKPFLINLIDTALIRTDLLRAKQKGADVSIVYFHWGEEYQTEPNNFQELIADFTLTAGADLIIASHPHVLQKVKFFKKNDSKIDTSFIAFSLGNFISNQQWRYSDAGVIFEFDLEKNRNTDKVKLANIKLTPTWVYKGLINKKRSYLILPAYRYEDTTYTFLSKDDKIKMEQAFFDSKSILNNLKDIPNKGNSNQSQQ